MRLLDLDYSEDSIADVDAIILTKNPEFLSSGSGEEVIQSIVK